MEVMNNKHSECQTPFTKCWCEALPGRMNNTHCQSLMPSVSIQSDVFTIILLVIALLYMLRIFGIIKPLHKRIQDEDAKLKKQSNKL